MNDDFIQRLHSAESDFLTALGSGVQMLTLCSQTWSTLLIDLSTASLTGSVCSETLSLAHLVSSRISNIASCYLDVKLEEENITAQLRGDCDAMLHQMNALNLNPNIESKSLCQDGCPSMPHHPTTLTTQNVEGSSPPFVASAYRWLLDNLHNPYPAAEVKAQIAAASSCQVSSVNSWFINARRRIGWTTLCRERFSNCRADMIDAAYRALVEEDPQRTLSPELRHSFVATKVAAEGLYSSTLTRSTFAGDLDAILKDMTEEHQAFVEAGKYRQAEQTNLRKAVRDSYPSPDRSTTPSLVPTLDDCPTDESEEEEDVTPPIIAGSKRRRLSIEPVNQLSSISKRPVKRLRVSMTSQTYLPSPPSSTDGIEVPSDDSSPEPPSVHSARPKTNDVLTSRKRRLSDADATGIPKRPRGSMATPRDHIVSDPLLRSNMENEYSIDDWFNTKFDALFAIPPPVDATEPDLSASWEVELFRDYSIPGNPNCAPKCPPAPSADTRISSVSDLSELDSLLQSITSDTFVTPLESVSPSNITEVPCTVSLDSSMPDVSHIDWTSLLNGPDMYQSAIHSTFPQYPTHTQPLPEVDLSMLQLPHVVPPVNSQGDFASKQAKLHQLHAMQEAVRRMEQELQLEGVIT